LSRINMTTDDQPDQVLDFSVHSPIIRGSLQANGPRGDFWERHREAQGERIYVGLYHRSSQPEDLFRHIYGDSSLGSEGWMVAFSGQQARLRNPEAPANQLVGIRQGYFRYPAQCQEAADHLLSMSQRGRDAYVGVHLFRKAGNRLAANAVGTVSCLWMDEDEGSFPEHGPHPTAIVHSSRGRRHLYWRLSYPVAVEWAMNLNRRISHWAGGDIGKAGLASVLRVPGTLNFKRAPENDPVTGEFSEDEWPPEVIDQAVPELPPEEEISSTLEPYDGPVLELTEFLEGVEVIGARQDGKATKFAIVCPWAEEHSGGDQSGTFIGQRVGGGLWFHCNHAHCAERGWRAFRKKVGRVRHMTITIGPRGFIRKEDS
jgi:hypothetical protein